MRPFRVITAVLALALVFAASTSAQQTAEELYQAGLYEEEVQGNLERAIHIYERILEGFPDNRPVAAKALMHIGLCYEKLGRTEAERAYRRVVTDYADQRDVVDEARARLTAIERAQRAAEVVSISTRQVQVDPLARTEAFAPSPDGGSLLFVDWEIGDLAIRDLATDEFRFLTHEASWGDPEQYAWGASVSPDGMTVAYLWAEENASSLHLVGIDGSNSRVLSREDGCGIWSHAWTHDSKGIVAMRDCGPSEGVVLFSVADASARSLMDSAQLAASSLSLADRVSVSPDDRYASVDVTVEHDGGNHDIWIVALDGSGAASLIQHPADDRLIGWVPNTEHVVFLSDRDGRWDLWAAHVKDGLLVGSPRLIRRNTGMVGAGGWRPLGFTSDGALYYSVFTRWNSLSVAPLDPATGTPDEESAVPILGSNFQPTWSPDGEYLAFVTEQERTGGPDPGPYRRPLHIRHLATGTERELAPHLQTRTPSWSPDGRFILTNGRDETNQSADYHGGLYRIDVESGEASPVLELEGDTKTPWWYGIRGVWAGHSEAIIYSQYDGNQMVGRLVWRELESGRERLLYRDSLLTTRLLALSPDGNRLVFAVRDSLGGGSVAGVNVGGRLMILDLEDGAIRGLHVIQEPGNVGCLQWTPDGEHVLFARTETEDRHTGVWRVPTDGGDAEELWTFGKGQYAGGFYLSPDGRRVAFGTYTQEYEVWVMENLVAALNEQQ